MCPNRFPKHLSGAPLASEFFHHAACSQDKCQKVNIAPAFLEDDQSLTQSTGTAVHRAQFHLLKAFVPSKHVIDHVKAPPIACLSCLACYP